MSDSTTATADISRRETTALIAASKVNGTRVYNQQGHDLGQIYDVMLEKRSGKVSYAILSFGGFLGMGEKYHPLPWSRLSYSEQYGGYVIDLDKTVLENAPVYDDNDRVDWSPAYGEQVDKYYGGLPNTI